MPEFPFDAALVECPYLFYAAQRAQRPVDRIRDGDEDEDEDEDEYLVSRYDDVVYVTTHPEIFSNAHSTTPSGTFSKSHRVDEDTRRGRGAAMIHTDPPWHKRKRDRAFQAFKPGRLKAYEPMIAGHVNALIDRFLGHGAVEFVAEFADPMPILVTMSLFGLPPADFDDLTRWSTVEASGLPYLPPKQRAEIERLRRDMYAYCEAAVIERRSAPREDVISEYVQATIAADGHDFDLGEAVAEILNLFHGGITTTAHLIASAMLLLVQHPSQLQEVRTRRTLIPRMLEEALRVESPVQWLPRLVLVDTELGGVAIPAGARVLLMFGSANRDERRFAHPEAFHVDRENVKDHLSFGRGVHFCLGAPLARLEAEIAFNALFDRLGEIRLAPGRNDFMHIESVLHRGPRSLYLEFDGVPGQTPATAHASGSIR